MVAVTTALGALAYFALVTVAALVAAVGAGLAGHILWLCALLGWGAL